MGEIKGMLVKKESRSSIILTPDGEFIRVPYAFPENRPGAEVICRPGPARRLRLASLAAALLVALLTWQLFWTFLPQAAAYVSLDFGPSLELALNEKGEIIKARSLNREGEALIAELALRGSDLKQGLTLILAKGLKPESPEPVLCTFTPGRAKKIPPGFQAQVTETISRVLEAQPVSVPYQVKAIPPRVRVEAQQKRISPGRYLLHLEAQKKGITISLPELREEKWSILTRKHQDALNHLLQAVPSRRPDSPGRQPSGNTGKQFPSLPPGEEKVKPPKEKTPLLPHSEDSEENGRAAQERVAPPTGISAAPEEQIEEQGQKEAQEQTGNKREVKGKISPLHKKIPGQPAQRRDLAQ